MSKINIIKIGIVVLASICVLGFWRFTCKYVNSTEDTRNNEIECNTSYTDKEINSNRYSVLYDDSGEYLLSPKGIKITGPYLKIYSEDISESDQFICRYVDKNGLIGYMNQDGIKITKPIFTQASRYIENAPVRVKTTKSGVYYIDNYSFERISEDFAEGSEFEHQGCYARVKLLTDQKYGIMNKKGKVILKGMDYINPLPYVLGLATAKLSDGSIAILSLKSGNDDSVNIIYKSDDYSEISKIHFDTYAYIKDSDGNVGVIDFKGTVIIQPEYERIDAKIINSEDSKFLGDKVEFTCFKKDGTQQVIIKEW